MKSQYTTGIVIGAGYCQLLVRLLGAMGAMDIVDSFLHAC